MLTMARSYADGRYFLQGVAAMARRKGAGGAAVLALRIETHLLQREVR